MNRLLKTENCLSLGLIMLFFFKKEHFNKHPKMARKWVIFLLLCLCHSFLFNVLRFSISGWPSGNDIKFTLKKSNQRKAVFFISQLDKTGDGREDFVIKLSSFSCCWSTAANHYFRGISDFHNGGSTDFQDNYSSGEKIELFSEGFIFTQAIAIFFYFKGLSIAKEFLDEHGIF